MNKARLEAFSDGVFSIVLTLLVLDLHVPTLVNTLSNHELLTKLALIWPVFGSFLLSFLVISIFWINHHFLFTTFVNEVDRVVNLLNIVYLLFLVLVPFSANLFGEYPKNQVAATIYGLNILLNVLVLRIMFVYAHKANENSDEISSRIVKQARIRTTITLFSYLLGVAFAFIYIPASIFLYLFPMLFNIIPGSLNVFERIFNFKIT